MVFLVWVNISVPALCWAADAKLAGGRGSPWCHDSSSPAGGLSGVSEICSATLLFINITRLFLTSESYISLHSWNQWNRVYGASFIKVILLGFFISIQLNIRWPRHMIQMNLGLIFLVKCFYLFLLPDKFLRDFELVLQLYSSVSHRNLINTFIFCLLSNATWEEIQLLVSCAPSITFPCVSMGGGQMP